MTTAVLLFLLAAPAPAAEKRKPLALSVRSKDYVIRREPKREEEWSGDVWYRQRGREVHADWALRQHDTELWQARGNVRMKWRLEDGSTLEAKGDRARHDGVSNKGTLLPKPGGFVDYERRLPDQPGPDRGRARRMSWDSDAERVRLEGDVHLWGPSGRAWSDAAVYVNSEDALVLTGRRPVIEPVTESWEGAVQADRLRAERHDRLRGDGDVRGWLLFRDKEAAIRRAGGRP